MTVTLQDSYQVWSSFIQFIHNVEHLTSGIPYTFYKHDASALVILNKVRNNFIITAHSQPYLDSIKQFADGVETNPKVKDIADGHYLINVINGEFVYNFQTQTPCDSFITIPPSKTSITLILDRQEKPYIIYSHAGLPNAAYCLKAAIRMLEVPKVTEFAKRVFINLMSHRLNITDCAEWVMKDVELRPKTVDSIPEPNCEAIYKILNIGNTTTSIEVITQKKEEVFFYLTKLIENGITYTNGAWPVEIDIALDGIESAYIEYGVLYLQANKELKEISKETLSIIEALPTAILSYTDPETGEDDVFPFDDYEG